MRILIVDDEPPTRARLRQLLSSFPDCEVVGEAGNGDQALQQVLQLMPDLIFLDIQMPGPNGLEVAMALPLPRPKIIFCTAFDQYAVDAFELHAVDYLLKPVNRTRLSHALEHVRLSSPSDLNAAVDKAARSLPGGLRRFLVRQGNGFRIIPRQEVLYLSSEGGLTRLHTAPQNYVMDPTLNEYEERLDSAFFFRLSRTAIVNLDHVQEVHPLTGGFGKVVLKNGVQLEVSRRRLKPLIERLEGQVNGPDLRADKLPT